MRTMRDIMEAVASGSLLYHTTSHGAAEAILETTTFKPKQSDGYISFSERPLPNGDIEGRDVTLGLRASAFIGKTEEVIYSEDWFAENPDKGSYIAGEGWREQYIYEPSEDDYDADGEYDDEGEEAFYRDAELSAFEDKSHEDEHISRNPGEQISFQPADVVVLIIHSHFGDESAEWRLWLDQHGYEHVAVRTTT